MATVYLNADSGDDARSYAQAQNSATPWLTPGKVNSSATTGDTCVMQESVADFTWANITFSKGLSFVGPSIISPARINAGNIAAGWTLGAYTHLLENILFKNCPSAFLTMSGVHNVTLRGVKFDDDILLNTAKYGLLECNSTAGAVLNLDRVEFNNVRQSSATARGLLGTNVLLGGVTITLERVIAYWGTGSNPAAYLHYRAYDTPVVVIRNSILSNQTGGTITYGTSTNTASYSDLHLLTGAPSGTGVITSDPLWVDPVNGNFNLQQDSPCVGVGAP